jgi:type IV secretion system protein VirD4
MANTTSKNASKGDPFWEQSEKALLQALVLYLMHEAPKNEQNFGMVMYLVENCATREDENYQSPVDVIFEDLEKKNAKHIAVKQYKIFKQASGKTAKSILVSLAVRLATFNLPSFQHITSFDNMDLGSLGDKKRVIFAVIPDNDTSFNYLVGMLYSQAFQELYRKADETSDGRLETPVRVVMDEFANVALPEDFERILSTCRSREISINIIVQNIAQLKALFEKSWENITGNCDSFVYLGGNEQSTHEYVSKMLGKETIDTTTRGLSRGRNGSSSQNFQNTGRELLTPDEVRMLDNRYLILFIRGERAVLDDKFDILKHQNITLTTDGGAKEVKQNYKITPQTQKDLSKNYNKKEIEIYEN